jgi:hypothetical protein
VRTVAEYIAKAEDFLCRAKREHEPAAQKRLLDMAASYRVMATERQRMIEAGENPDASLPKAGAK